MYGKSDATDEDVLQAATQANCLDFIQSNFNNQFNEEHN